MLQALSPLDGRYESAVAALRPFFSEQALIGARIEIEIRYLIALSEEKGVQELRLTRPQKKALEGIIERFSTKDAEEVKKFEKTTNHDVKAVEYFLKARMTKIAGLSGSVEFLHFGLTSEDVNNLAYGILIQRALKAVIMPSLAQLMADLHELAKSGGEAPLLSLTHGQAATPTTLGKEMDVFRDRLARQIGQMKAFRMQGKLGGAVGNFSAHRAAYPSINWEKFRDRFVRALGLELLANTTQINPHDDLAELSHLVSRINTILLDYSRDMWLYISRGVFKQRVVAGEVGSSTMPHKVNPIDFENAEGNLGLSTALFSHFAEKLPVSRLQRDLSDSTVQRSIGVAFGYHLLAVQSLRKGISRVALDRARIQAELQAHPEVHTEAIQTILRKYKVTGAYEKLKEWSRGKNVTLEGLAKYVKELPLPQAEIARILGIIKG